MKKLVLIDVGQASGANRQGFFMEGPAGGIDRQKE
jgi:hypothetical protein